MRPSTLGAPRLEEKFDVATDATETKAFVKWWFQRWNEVLGQLIDPEVHFWVPNVTFSPDLMVDRFLSLVRMLASMQEVLINTARSEFLRTMMLFDVLDLMKGIGGGLGGYDRMADPRLVERDLSEIEEVVTGDPAVAKILLPRCRSAVDDLSALRVGFIAPPTNLDAAVRSLMQELRNARHGFDQQGASHSAMTEFFNHRMDVSADIADLGWLHLIRMLCSARLQTAGELRVRLERRRSAGPA